jgi:2-methylcitrate dehydratase PrpD
MPSADPDAFSYAAQQASGIPFWQRDGEHVEKAFDFGGMGARNGVAAGSMVAAGFSAVYDPFNGPRNFFTAFGEDPRPDLLVQDLGTRFEIEQASIKKWFVGSPIQSVLDAVTSLISDHDILGPDVREIVITMPDDRIHIVDARVMPSVCVQHLVAVALLDGTVTFDSSHDAARMLDPAVLDLRRLIRLVPSPELTVARPARQFIVEIDTVAGARFRRHAAVRGTPDDPMTIQEVSDKFHQLVETVIGRDRTARLNDLVHGLERAPSVDVLGDLLVA